MERSRELKREENRHWVAKQRQPKASGHKLVPVSNGGDGELLEISKKERIRSSSKDEEMMMGVGSEGEEEFRLARSSSGRRFKTNGTAFDDCNAVDPAAVPRRLRSAMNKRKHESLSPPLTDGKKNNHPFAGTESANVNAIKKSKAHMKQGRSDRSLKQVVLSATTKDEEEVVEALYSLASMVDEPAKSKVDRAANALVPFPLSETKTGSLPPSVASKEETTKSPNVLVGEQAFSATSCEESSAETVNVEPVNGTTVLERPASFEVQKLQWELKDSAHEDVQEIDLLSKDEQTGHTQLNDAINSITPMEIPSKSYPGNGLRETIKPRSLPMRKEIVPLPVMAVTTKPEAKPIKEKADESCTHIQEGAPDLQPATPKKLSHGHWLLTQMSSNKAGTWPDSTTCASRPSSTGNYVSKEKIAPVSVRRRQSMKRCALHVHISRLIHVYQGMEKKSSCPPSSDQSKLKGVEFGIATPSNQTPVKTGVSNVKSVAAHGFVADSNSHEARTGTLQDNRLLQDQQASTSSGICHPQNQSCDFLSMAAGCESKRNPGNKLESSVQLNVPYLHPLVQYPVVPFSLQHACYTSPYPDQAAAAAQQVQLPLSQYSGNSFCGPQLWGDGSSAKQQQQLCASQMAHHRLYYPPSSLHFPKWQNGRYEAPSLIPCSQGIVGPPPSSLGVLRPNNMSSSRQLFPVSSSSPSSGGKRQHHHNHPGSFNEDGAGFRSDGVPHLQQLLCNAQNIAGAFDVKSRPPRSGQFTATGEGYSNASQRSRALKIEPSFVASPEAEG